MCGIIGVCRRRLEPSQHGSKNVISGRMGKEKIEKERTIMTGKKTIIFIDSGDTLVDESTEIRKVPGGIVYEAELVEGTEEALRELRATGHIVAMVADGYKESFDRIYGETLTKELFDVRAISEIVGEEKPSSKMFQTAMDALNLTEEDKPRIIMVGNNLERDIVGANRFGIHSVLMDWSPRYPMTPRNEEEIPQYRVHSPRELVELVKKLDTEEEDLRLAKKYAPVLLFDEKEPFKVDAIGCTVIREDGKSPSSPKKIRLGKNGRAVCIEYAVYFDYDIQHLYDLEHVWVYLNEAGEVVDCDSSFHGMYLNAWGAGTDLLRGTEHVHIYSQPGKHAMLPEARLFHFHEEFKESCMELAGNAGILDPGMYPGFPEFTPEDDKRTENYIKKHFCFVPADSYQEQPLPDEVFMTWPRLRALIPIRIAAELKKIRQNQ